MAKVTTKKVRVGPAISEWRTTVKYTCGHKRTNATRLPPTTVELKYLRSQGKCPRCRCK